MGLPIDKLIVATNQNDILKRVINTGLYKPLKVEHTVSPSMDIQVASNFERLIFDVCSCNSKQTTKLMNDLSEQGELKLEKEELKKIRENFCSESLSEEETKSVIDNVFKNEKILVDPHTAVGIGVVKKLSLDKNIVILATAHPAKFSDIVKEATGIEPQLPESLRGLLNKEEKYEKLSRDLEKVKNYILEKVKK